MITKTKCLVLLPTLNEKNNISKIAVEILTTFPSIDLLIVDGNSTDGTLEEIQLLLKDEKFQGRIRLILQKSRLGLASAHLIGFIHSMKNDYQILVTMDSDGSHQPKEIQKILSALNESNIVIGSRYCKGGKSDLTGFRGLLSKLANLIAKFVITNQESEFTTAFRGFKVESLKKLDLKLLNTRGYSFFFRTIYAAKIGKLTISEVPIHFKLREQGESKIPKLEIFHSIRSMVIIMIHKRKKIKDPVYFTDESEMCPICNSFYTSRILGNKKNYVEKFNNLRCSQEMSGGNPTLMKCYVCGHIFAHRNEWPKNTENSYHEVEDSLYLQFASVKKKTFLYLYNYLLKLNERSSTLFDSVLEIGSYAGMFLDELKNHSIFAIGIEPSRWGYEKCIMKKHNVINLSFEEYFKNYSPKEEFSLITSWDVLEHVESPKDFISSASIALKNDGYFVFSTLDVENWFPKLMGSKWPWYMPMHLHYFNDRTIKDLLASNQFEFVGKQAYRSYASLKYAGTRLLSSMGLSKSLCDFIGKFIPKLTIPFFFGDVVMYTAKKKGN